MVESSLSNEHEKASFLAASAPHSGDWVLPLPTTACGLRQDDEAVRAAIALTTPDPRVPHIHVYSEHILMPMVSIVWFANVLQEKLTDTGPL